MASSPRTPTHRRFPSNIDVSGASSSKRSSISSPVRHSHSRKSSINSPTTPGGQYGGPLRNSFTMSSGLDGVDNGFGNLADELADAWDEDEDVMIEKEDMPEEEEAQMESSLENIADSGIDVASSPGFNPGPGNSLSNRAAHRKKQSQSYPKSVEEESEQESAEMISRLESQMSTIAALVRDEETGRSQKEDDVVKRLINSLADLGGQSGIENGISRLVTAHSALSTHITNQTRTVHSLSFPILSPLHAFTSPDLTEELLPLIASTLSLIPAPSSAALTTLHELSSLTTDLLAHLSMLSDSLHMSRQATTMASRRLKTVTEMVRDQRRETEQREEGIRWITKGQWDERLQNRDCKIVWGEVVGGFEEVCQDWRKRLIVGLGAA